MTKSSCNDYENSLPNTRSPYSTVAQSESQTNDPRCWCWLGTISGRWSEWRQTDLILDNDMADIVRHWEEVNETRESGGHPPLEIVIVGKRCLLIENDNNRSHQYNFEWRVPDEE